MISKKLKNMLSSSISFARPRPFNPPRFINIQTNKRIFSSEKEKEKEEANPRGEKLKKVLPDWTHSKIDKIFKKKNPNHKGAFKIFIHHMKVGLSGIYQNTKFLAYIVNKNRLDWTKYTAFELIRRREATRDFIKFLPYSVFLSIPLLEAALPFYIAIFPNSVPEAFMFESQRRAKQQMKKILQEEAYENMKVSLPKFVNILGLDPIKYLVSSDKMLDTEGEEKDRYFYKVSDYEAKLYNFLNWYSTASLEKREAVLRSIKFERLSAFELEQMARLLYIDYFRGTNIINSGIHSITRLPFFLVEFLFNKLGLETPKIITFYKSTRVYQFEFDFNSGIGTYVKRALLLVQIKHHMMHIQRQDKLLYERPDLVKNIDEKTLLSFARERGLVLEDDDPEELKQLIFNHYLPISAENDVPAELLVWISFLRFSYADILV